MMFGYTHEVFGKIHLVRFGDGNVVQWMAAEGLWFRVHGYGLIISRKSPGFSERMGLKKVFRVFGWHVSVLRPNL